MFCPLFISPSVFTSGFRVELHSPQSYKCQLITNSGIIFPCVTDKTVVYYFYLYDVKNLRLVSIPPEEGKLGNDERTVIIRIKNT